MFRFVSNHKILSIFFVIVLAACTMFYVYISHLLYTIPDLSHLINYRPQEATIVYDTNDKVITNIESERRYFYTIDQIPDLLKNAFIATEDKTFYTNNGIDAYGLMLAIGKNIITTLRANGRYVGASTITQQVIRNTILSHERTLDRKIREIILSLRLSKILPKDRILEIYLNQIYLGLRAYGVGAAADVYFGKKLENLELAEIALIAAMAKAPSSLNVKHSYDRILDRRNWIIDRMLQDGYITNEEHEAAVVQPISLIEHRPRESFEGALFIDYMKSQLLSSGLSEKELNEDGFIIKTTLNKSWQKIAQDVMQNGIDVFDKKHGYRGPIAHIVYDNQWCKKLSMVPLPKKLNKRQIAVVMELDNNHALLGLRDCTQIKIHVDDMKWARKHITQDKLGDVIKKPKDVLAIGDVVAVSMQKEKFILDQVPDLDGGMVVLEKNGKIRAMVGGYMDLPGTFNRAVQAQRHPGSCVKPFVYILALDKGLTPSTVLMDVESNYYLNNGEVWSPKNWNHKYLGPITMRTAVNISSNVVAAKTGEQVGIDNVGRLLYNLRATSMPKHELSLTLGAFETNILDFTRAYGAILNYGKAIPTSFIESMTCTRNTENEDHINEVFGVLADSQPKNDTLFFSPQSAYQMIYMMTMKSQKGVSVSGKSGTSSYAKDLWYVIMTPDLIIGAYTGYDTPSSTGDHEYGNITTMPILLDFVRNIAPELKNKRFHVPQGIVMVRINKKTGYRTSGSDPDAIYEAFKVSDPLPPEQLYNQENGLMTDDVY